VEALTIGKLAQQGRVHIGLTDDAFPGTVQTMKLSDTRPEFQAIHWSAVAVILAIAIPFCVVSTVIRISSPVEFCQSSLNSKGLCPQGATHHNAPALFLAASPLPAIRLDLPGGLFAPDHQSHPAFVSVGSPLRDRAPPIS